VLLGSPAVDPASVIADASQSGHVFGAPQKSPEAGIVSLPLIGGDGADLDGVAVQFVFMTQDGPFEVTRRVEASTGGASRARFAPQPEGQLGSMIQVGDRIPSVPVRFIDAKGVRDATSDAVLGQGRVVFFGVPGAFTPTCDTAHLPGFVSNAGKLFSHGVDSIVCGAVNDHHVVKAWAERAGALGKVSFISDVHAALADALGIVKQSPDLGKRFARFAMIIEDGVVQDLFIQDVAGVTVSGAPAVLLALETRKSKVA